MFPYPLLGALYRGAVTRAGAEAERVPDGVSLREENVDSPKNLCNRF